MEENKTVLILKFLVPYSNSMHGYLCSISTPNSNSLLNLQVSAWGGYVFIINLIPLHVFALILMNRYSDRIYVAYNTFFILGLLCSMQIPFVGFQPVKTSEHMASAG